MLVWPVKRNLLFLWFPGLRSEVLMKVQKSVIWCLSAVSDLSNYTPAKWRLIIKQEPWSTMWNCIPLLQQSDWTSWCTYSEFPSVELLGSQVLALQRVTAPFGTLSSQRQLLDQRPLLLEDAEAAVGSAHMHCLFCASECSLISITVILVLITGSLLHNMDYFYIIWSSFSAKLWCGIDYPWGYAEMCLWWESDR